MKKRLKGLISVFFFLLCIFAWKSVQEVRAAENVIRDFSRIFYIPAGAVLKGGSLQKLQEIYDGMSCIAYTEDGEELYLDAIWDYSGIDIQTVGAYKITGTVRLPEGYTSNVGLPEWTAWISVQNPGQPEIQVYSRMISAGIYYFPWITEQNPDMMEIWLQKEGEDWVNVSEEGYGFADTDGMYLSCQSMIAENIYTLTVVYNEGKTRNLKYRYQSDGSLEILSYQPGTIGGTVSKDTVIRSCEKIDEKSLQRCMVYAVRAGQSLAEVRTELEETFYIFGSTCEEYEDTAAHPAFIMHSVWDFSQVDVNAPGVYKVTGTFAAPEGCTVDQELTVPGAAAYITVQRPDQPEVQTCCVVGVDVLFFPMILDCFTDEQLDNLQVYLLENNEDKEIGKNNFYFDRKGLYLKNPAYSERAISLYRHACLLIGQNTDPEISEVSIHLEMAQVYISLGQTEKGLEILKKNNPCRLNHPKIGEVLASSCNDAKGALPYLSAALLDLTVTHMQIVMGYLNLYCKQRDYENALLLLDWALAFYPGLKCPQKRSYLDKSEAALWAVRADVLWRLEQKEDAADSLRKAKVAATAFDREPNYDARNIRFVSAAEAATAYDDMGSTAMDVIDTILADSDEPMLLTRWMRIQNEE